MLEPYSDQLVWLVVVGFLIAFILAFGIGANDVANSFGTSVGSKVLSVRQACCLATVFEIAGAILIGYKVSDTMRKGILEVSVYENAELELMLGCLSALSASAVWLLVATFFKLPISGTHSIVGATIGFSVVARGTEGVHWGTLSTIVASWFISPVLSGVMSIIFFLIIKHGILRRVDPLEAGLFLLPFFYGFTVFVNVFSIVHDGPKLLHMDNIPMTTVLAVSGGISLLCMLLVYQFVIPWQRKRIAEDLKAAHPPVSFSFGESAESSPDGSPKKSNRHSQLSDKLTVISENTEMLPIDNHLLNNKYTFPSANKNNGLHVTESSATILSADINPSLSPNSSAVPLIMEKQPKIQTDKERQATRRRETADTEETKSVSRLFSFLQVLTATFGSFAHGGNDVSNAIGPLIALWLIYTEGSVQQKSETPLYILLYGGLGISLGLWLWGRRVIKTIGEDLTTIVPSTGFTIEIGAASTVLLASKIGLPISTTHCKVGSVVFVGYVNSRQGGDPDAVGVDWKLFRNIISAWVVTVPVAALLSAGTMYVLQIAVGINQQE